MVICLCAATTIAHAQPGKTQSEAPPTVTTTTTVRYWTRIAAVDALGAGVGLLGTLLLVGGAIGGDEDAFLGGAILLIAGSAVYAFGPAFVHAGEDNPGSAWKSVALRLGLPALGGLIGSAITEDEDNIPALVGLGSTAAMVLDWAVLAKKTVTVQQPAYYPYVTVAPGGAAAGLTGAF